MELEAEVIIIFKKKWKQSLIIFFHSTADLGLTFPFQFEWGSWHDSTDSSLFSHLLLDLKSQSLFYHSYQWNYINTHWDSVKNIYVISIIYTFGRDRGTIQNSLIHFLTDSSSDSKE